LQENLLRILHTEKPLSMDMRRLICCGLLVKPSKGKDEYNQFIHLRQALDEVKKKTGVEIKTVVNQDYVSAINKLRQVAQQETKELKSPIMRFLQIEHYALHNLKRLKRNE
jgi:hypothetical protein